MNYRLHLFVLALAALAGGLREGRAVDAPVTIDYQGTVYDSTGKPYGATGTAEPFTAAPENIAMEFRIYDQLTGQNVVWAESQLVTVNLGRFSVRLGAGTALGNYSHDLAAAFTGGKDRFVGLTVRKGAEPFGEITPRLAFLSAPYALVTNTAKLADHATTAGVAQSVVDTASASKFKDVEFVNLKPAANTTTSVTASTLEATGQVKANFFTGSGSGLTDIPADKITSGFLNEARLTSNIARLNGADNRFTGKNTFVAGDNSFAGSGAALTNLNAGSLATGTVPDARLSNEIIKGYVLNNRALLLRGGGDSNHSLGWGGGDPFNMDGPVLTGFSGGVLGTRNGSSNLGTTVVRWTDQAVNINRDLFLRNTLNAFPGAWHIYQAQVGHTGGQGDELRFGYAKDGDPLPVDEDTSRRGIYFYIQKSGSTGNTSDRRLKKDIAPMGSTLESVLKLRAILYRTINQDSTAALTAGYIAQDVQPLFPSVVTEHDGYLGLAYQDLAVYATKALQELAAETRAQAAKTDAEIRSLQDENRDLRRSLGDLERRLNALEVRSK